MKHARILRLLAWGLVAAFAAHAHATGPAFWTVTSSAEFLSGTSNGAFVSLDGAVSAGPSLTNRLQSTPQQVWALATDPSGTVWAGTGGDGRVLRLSGDQPEETIFDAEESNVFAIATSDTRTFAATGPDGRVYAIARDGSTAPFFDPDETYVWALTLDSSGNLWVGAGTPAVIYRVSPDGTSVVVYRPPAAHVVSLTATPDGQMLVGTESPGRLYRIGSDGRPFVLLDSGLTEHRAIAVAPDGAIYTAGIERTGSAESTDASAAVTLASATSRAGSAEPASSSPAGRSQLFRIEPDGTWESIWATPDIIYDLQATASGAVLAATGPVGRLYRIEPSRDVLLLTGVDAKHITRFAAPGSAGQPTAFATANPGRVVSIGSTPHANAAYTSAVHDTSSVATWGLLRWEAEGVISLATRSGNTATPDDSWSDWSGLHQNASGVTIDSPAARFLQWRAILDSTAGTTAPRLHAVTAAYLPRNSRPDVTEITVHPPGVVFQRPFSSDDAAIAGLDDAVAAARRPPGDTSPASAPGRRMYQKSLQTIAWKASDANGDRLTFELEYRREGEGTWRPLQSALLNTIYVWDTTSVPDGRYQVRLLASDAATNAAGRALVGTRESSPIVIDNTPPTVTASLSLAGTTRVVTVDTVDDTSPIATLEYAIAGGPWQMVFPADGLADAPSERYLLTLDGSIDPGDVVVRVTDALRNVTTHPVGR